MNNIWFLLTSLALCAISFGLGYGFKDFTKPDNQVSNKRRVWAGIIAGVLSLVVMDYIYQRLTV